MREDSEEEISFIFENAAAFFSRGNSYYYDVLNGSMIYCIFCHFVFQAGGRHGFPI